MEDGKATVTPMEELKGLLTEIKGSQDAEKEAREEFNEKLSAIEERVGKQDEVLSKLESEGIPTTRNPELKELPIPGTAETKKVLFGYNFDIQGADLKRNAENSDLAPYIKGYTMLADEDQKQRYAKFLLTTVKALKGDWNAIKQMQDLQVKANELIEGTTTAGGYLVPDEYANEILGFARLTSVALRDCRIMPMGTDTKRIPAESTNVTVSWTSEASALTQKYPVLAEVVLTTKKVGGYCIVSNELLADSAFDVVSWLTSQFAEALGQEIDNEVFQGDGSESGVSGLTTAACGYSVSLSGSISTITGTNLSSMIGKLSPNKRAGAKFYVNKDVFHYIRTLKDSQNAFIYNPIGGVQANTIWGYPVQEVEQMPSTDGTGQPIVVFGNLNSMIIGRRLQNTTMDVDPYSGFTSDLTNFRIYWRIAIAIGLANAFVRAITG
jgi:HK97 family phage major capsid protein